MNQNLINRMLGRLNNIENAANKTLADVAYLKAICQKSVEEKKPIFLDEGEDL